MNEINHEYYVSLEIAKLLKKAGFDWKVEFFYQDEILRSVLPDVLFNGNFEDIEYYYKHIGIPHYSLNYNSGSSKFLEEYSAPTLDVAQRWLREIKNFNIYVQKQSTADHHYFGEYYFQINEIPSSLIPYETYEEAQEAGIKKALEIILEKGE